MYYFRACADNFKISLMPKSVTLMFDPIILHFFEEDFTRFEAKNCIVRVKDFTPSKIKTLHGLSQGHNVV